MILEAEADLVPMGPRSPLRSGRCRADIPDVLRSPLRFGRCRTDVPRTSCNPSSARLRLLWGRRPWVQGLRFASVVAEQTSSGCLAVSAPLRSLQNRRPPDVLQPIFRKAPIVVGQAGYTYSVQDCILDQKERTIL